MQQKKIDIAIARDFPIKVIPLINQAKKTIDIIVYDWRWYATQVGSTIQKFNYSIVRARNRGVQIRAVLNSDYMCKKLKELRFETSRGHSLRTIHTKLMIIDEKITIIGSHNYTKSAFEINHEASIIIKSKKIALEFTNYFLGFFN